MDTRRNTRQRAFYRAGFALTAWLFATALAAQVPTTLNYQGQLLANDANQTPTTGTVDIDFSIWSDATGGIPLWTESWTDIALSNGVFTVLLGSNGTPLDPADFQGDSSLFLQLVVDGEPLSPRRQLGAAPFALVDEPANEIQDLTLADHVLSLTGSTATVDLSPYAENTFSTIAGNSGSTTADTPGDTLHIVGAGTVSTSVSGDTLTLTGTSDGLGAHTATQNLDLSTFKLVGNGGTEGLSIAADGTVGFDNGLEFSDLTLTPGAPTLAGTLGIGDTPRSISVVGRYAYVVDTSSTDLKVIDVTNPNAPSLVSSLSLGGAPLSVFAAGRYAYVLNDGVDALQVIDLSTAGVPTLVGSVAVGSEPRSVFVAGRYAYVVDAGSSDLKVIDVSNPDAPTVTGSLGLGGAPNAVFLAGRYAYVTATGAADLTVIDVSEPSAPALAGSLTLGGTPTDMFVSGRYAYLTDASTQELKTIDVVNPGAPILAGSLGIGNAPTSVFVAGSFAYVTDEGTDDLKVIDLSSPRSPTLVESLGIGSIPSSLFVSGRYAYVVDSGSKDLKVLEISGVGLSSMIAHSLEAGSLQVRENLTTQGQLAVTGGVSIGVGGMFSDGNMGISGTLALANDIPPTASLANRVQLYAEDASGSSELKVRDEAGNVTTLSPHNFSLIGEPSEPLAWSYYSENTHGTINVDMLRTVRLVEQMSGETLVHTAPPPAESIPGSTHDSSGPRDAVAPAPSLRAQVKALQEENEFFTAETEALRKETRAMKAFLCRNRPEADLCQEKPLP